MWHGRAIPFLIVPNELPQVPMSNDTTWHVQIYQWCTTQKFEWNSSNGCGLICWFWNVAAKKQNGDKETLVGTWCNKNPSHLFPVCILHTLQDTVKVLTNLILSPTAVFLLIASNQQPYPYISACQHPTSITCIISPPKPNLLWSNEVVFFRFFPSAHVNALLVFCYLFMVCNNKQYVIEYDSRPAII